MPSFVHGKGTKILLAQHELTPFFKEVSGGQNADEVDTTAFGVGAYKTFIAGFISANLTLTGMFENTTNINPGGTAKTLDEVLDDILGDDSINRLLAVGIDGFGVGKRVRMFEGTELAYELVSGIGDVVQATANFSSKAPSRTGWSLHDLTEETGAANGTTVDGDTGLASTPVGGSVSGAIGQLHVTENARAGATTVKVQHSDDGSVWVDLITFDAVAAGSEEAQRKEVTGNVRRYLRATWTGTGDITFIVAAARLT